MMDHRYVDTVRLLLDVAPEVFAEPDFALKGGTAINLFVRDMPRLSVDIDVVYRDHRRPRDEALAEIAMALGRVRERLSLRGFRVDTATSPGDESKLFVRHGTAMVKIEVNHVFRGTVLETGIGTLVERAQDLFTTEISVPILATAELFGSKLVAAMDRQHPRDLYDVIGMYESCGLSQDVVECFVCYLAGHNRPVHEVLFSRKQDIAKAYQNEFQGLSQQPIELDDLLAVQDRLWDELPAALTDRQRAFLNGLVRARPDWELMQCAHLAELPAIRWKLQNLTQLESRDSKKFGEQARLLEAKFGKGS